MGKWSVLIEPHSMNLSMFERSAYVRFSLLALSSIFFLVNPFAALPTLLAVTADGDKARRQRMAWKASLTALVFLSSFALGGQFIFKVFGITLPALRWRAASFCC